MESLFEPDEVRHLKQRILQLSPQSPRQWGGMSVAQALAHCSAGLQMAMGETREPRVFIGRILGPLIKPLAMRDHEPLRRNAPTSKALTVSDERDFHVEREKICNLIDRFATGGPESCTKHPHPFFGTLTPQQWSKLMHKHLDHHLRQFGG
jgi:uncharacterized protein YjeT (DUF2065 family)